MDRHRHADHPAATTLDAAPYPDEPAVVGGIVSDPALSFGAKGLPLWALARPVGQVLSRAELGRAGRGPLHALTDALHDLVMTGWLATVPAGQRVEAAEGFVVREDPDEPGDDHASGDDRAHEEPASAGVGKGVVG